MTRIDFHILSCSELTLAVDYVSRLADKAWRSGHEVLVHCDEAWLDALDEQLWAFRSDAFVPHQALSEGHAPVNLTSSEDCGAHHDVMINFSHRQPPGFSRFTRLIEVVFEEEALKSAKREHYKFYQERGYPLKNQRVASQ